MAEKEIDRPTFEEFKRAYPRQYAELCENTGRIDAALEFYSGSDKPGDVFRGAELAFREQRYDLAKGLIKRTAELSKKMMAEAEERADRDSDGGLGAAFCYASACDIHERGKRMIKDLRERIARIEGRQE